MQALRSAASRCVGSSPARHNVATFSTSSQTENGVGNAMQISMTQAGSGDRKAMMQENSPARRM